jgi:hypothetical protein
MTRPRRLCQASGAILATGAAVVLPIGALSDVRAALGRLGR